jgi:hypothetical protein
MGTIGTGRQDFDENNLGKKVTSSIKYRRVRTYQMFKSTQTGTRRL